MLDRTNKQNLQKVCVRFYQINTGYSVNLETYLTQVSVLKKKFNLKDKNNLELLSDLLDSYTKNPDSEKSKYLVQSKIITKK